MPLSRRSQHARQNSLMPKVKTIERADSRHAFTRQVIAGPHRVDALIAFGLDISIKKSNFTNYKVEPDDVMRNAAGRRPTVNSTAP